MRAIVLHGVEGKIAVEDVPVPQAGPGQAVVRLAAAALNHRDVWIWKGLYAGLKFPFIPGSDGAGVVVSVGSAADEDWVGRDVIINPSLGWGLEQSAQDPASFRILGLPEDGTLAEYVAVPAENLVARPEHLTYAEAAALPLAGLTAYRAVTRQGWITAGERVLITGIGGGVAMFAAQFAFALGGRVFVTSSSDDKLTRAAGLGAEAGANYTIPGWERRILEIAGGPFDLIIDSAGGTQFNTLIELAQYGGKIVFFGAGQGNVPELALRRVFWKQLTLQGTTMGSPVDFSEMISLVTERSIKPSIDRVFPLEQTADAFALMDQGGQFGKIVIEI